MSRGNENQLNGTAIRYCRLINRVTIKACAEKAGVSAATWGHWELKGVRSDRIMSAALAIRKACDWKPEGFKPGCIFADLPL